MKYFCAHQHSYTDAPEMSRRRPPFIGSPQTPLPDLDKRTNNPDPCKGKDRHVTTSTRRDNRASGTRFGLKELFTNLGIPIAVVAFTLVIARTQGTMTFDCKTPRMFLGTGYSGNDFIEAFMKKALP